MIIARWHGQILLSWFSSGSTGDHGGEFVRKGGVTAFKGMHGALAEGWNVALTVDVPDALVRPLFGPELRVALGREIGQKPSSPGRRQKGRPASN